VGTKRTARAYARIYWASSLGYCSTPSGDFRIVASAADDQRRSTPTLKTRRRPDIELNGYTSISHLAYFHAREGLVRSWAQRTILS
jgi:hypothetical protein